MSTMQKRRNNADFSVVRMGKEHIAQVAELEKKYFTEPWSENSLKLLVSDAGVAFVVLVADTVVAYGGMMTVLDEGQIANIAVAEEYRRCGYGEEIVSALQRFSIETGINLLSLEVRESNLAAIALYEKCGWKKCGMRKNFYRLPSESALVMTWTPSHSN